MKTVALTLGVLVGFVMARRLSSGYSGLVSAGDREALSSRQLSTDDAAILSAFHRDRLIFNKGQARDIPYVAGRSG